MAVTYYVALPFIRTEYGTAPGEAQECQSEAAAIRQAEGMSRDPANAGAVAFKRAGNLNVGEFFGRGCTEEVRRCAGRFERALTMVLLLRDNRVDRGWICRVVARSCSFRQLPRLRRSRAPPQCSDSVAMGAIADTVDAHSKRRF